MAERNYYSAWLNQHKQQVCNRLCELSLEAANLSHRPEPILQERVAFFVNQFLTYYQTGEVQIIIEQLETSSRQRLAQGMTISAQDSEDQHKLIIAAFKDVIEAGDLTPTQQAQLIVQINRSVNNVAVLSKLVHSRILLEDLNNNQKI